MNFVQKSKVLRISGFGFFLIGCFSFFFFFCFLVPNFERMMKNHNVILFIRNLLKNRPNEHETITSERERKGSIHRENERNSWNNLFSQWWQNNNYNITQTHIFFIHMDKILFKNSNTFLSFYKINNLPQNWTIET